jgi:thiol-activated cytolysin
MVKNQTRFPAGIRNIVLSLSLLSVAVPGCRDDGPDAGAIRIAEISDYIRSLQYDPDELLQVQPTAGAATARSETFTEPASTTRSGGEYITCLKKGYNLKSNAEEVAILRPTNGIVFPGALVRGDTSLLDGAPIPITLRRAPAEFRIDLPGMGVNGNLRVEVPDNGNVQAAVDQALQWWNDNAYEEGYVNPAYISYNASTSFSSEQLAIDVGLNVKWAAGNVASQFNYTSSTTRKVAMMVFKQGFYSVTMNTPEQPGQVFASDLNIEEVQSALSGGIPPAYVHSVVYGRIIMFRLETTVQASSTDLELALKYATGVTNVSGNTEVSVKHILANSNTTVITLGGNAAVASEAVSARNFGDLEKIIKGQNAVYSKSNPGVPIAYTVRYLKDNRLAKMGYTTDYQVEECSRRLVPGARITVQNDAGYVIRFSVRYRDSSGKSQSKGSGDFSAGFVRSVDLPDGAHDITLDVDFRSVFDWFDYFEKKYPVPQRKCYKVWGTLFDKRNAEVSCN